MCRAVFYVDAMTSSQRASAARAHSECSSSDRTRLSSGGARFRKALKSDPKKSHIQVLMWSTCFSYNSISLLRTICSFILLSSLQHRYLELTSRYPGPRSRNDWRDFDLLHGSMAAWKHQRSQ